MLTSGFHMRTQTYKHMHTYIHKHIYIYAYVYIQMYTHIHIHMCAHTVYTCTQVHTYAQTCVHTHVYTYMHTHTHMYTYICSHIHVSTHKSMCTYAQKKKETSEWKLYGRKIEISKATKDLLAVYICSGPAPLRILLCIRPCVSEPSLSGVFS